MAFDPKINTPVHYGQASGAVNNYLVVRDPYTSSVYGEPCQVVDIAKSVTIDADGNVIYELRIAGVRFSETPGRGFVSPAQ